MVHLELVQTAIQTILNATIDVHFHIHKGQYFIEVVYNCLTKRKVTSLFECYVAVNINKKFAVEQIVDLNRLLGCFVLY